MKKKQGKKYGVVSWIDVDMFDSSIMLSCGLEYSEIINTLKNKRHAKGWLNCLERDKDFIEGSKWCAIKSEYINEGNERICNYFIIIKPVFNFTDDQYCLLAHEVLHICQFILSERMNRHKEIECEAYLHTFIMKKCLNVLRE